MSSSLAMSDISKVLGLPQPTKKPSTLRKLRDPPAARYIDKQRAIAIARQLKIKRVGKVSLRVTGKVSLESEIAGAMTTADKTTSTRLSRRTIIDRTKGLQTARMAKDSAIGKCILGPMEYHNRRMKTTMDKLMEDEDKRITMLNRKTREFKHKHVIGNKKAGSHGGRLPSLARTDIAGRTSTEGGVRGDSASGRRSKSPGYMRPQSCNRTRSNETIVAEAEAFLASNFMRATLDAPDKANIDRALDLVEASNTDYVKPSQDADDREDAEAAAPFSRPNSSSSGHQVKTAPRTRPNSTSSQYRSRPVNRTHSPSALTKLPNRKSNNAAVASSSTQDGDENSQSLPNKMANAEGGTKESNPGLENTNQDHSLARGTKDFGDDNKDGHVTDERTPEEQTVDEGVEGAGDDTPEQMRPQLSRNLSRMRTIATVGSRMALMKNSTRRTRRKKNVAFSKTLQDAELENRKDVPYSATSDPRFLNLASALIPDSASARHLYDAMGNVSISDMTSSSKNNNKNLKGKALAYSRKSENVAKFESLLESCNF